MVWTVLKMAKATMVRASIAKKKARQKKNPLFFWIEAMIQAIRRTTTVVMRTGRSIISLFSPYPGPFYGKIL